MDALTNLLAAIVNLLFALFIAAGIVAAYSALIFLVYLSVNSFVNGDLLWGSASGGFALFLYHVSRSIRGDGEEK